MKSNIDRFNSRPGRLIIVAGVKWRWKVGHNNVIMYSETGQRLLESPSVIKGYGNSDIFYRGRRKKTSDGMLMPNEIEAWLLKQP